MKPPKWSRKETLLRIRKFLQTDIWDVEMTALDRMRRILVRTARVLLLVLQGFRRDECVLHASSLTFMSLLSFIPVLAIAFSMARAFGEPNLLRDRLKDGLHEWLDAGVEKAEPLAEEAESAAEEESSAESSPADGTGSAAEGESAPDNGEGATTDPTAESGHAALLGLPTDALPEDPVTTDRLDELIDLAFDRIEKLKFGALGGIGVVLLLWTVISVLGQVEKAFNRVWGVTEQRTFYNKFTDYLSVVVVVPLLLTALSTIPASRMLTQISSASNGTPVVALTAPVRLLRSVGMLAVLTTLMAFVLRFIPNTRVRFWPGLGGGFLVAVALTAWMRICLTFQIGLAKYSALFGSFALVPLLLFWVYVSWIILLVGAEFSFGLQNADTYWMEGGSEHASQRSRLLFGIWLSAEAARSVREGDGLLRTAEWTKKHPVPVRLLNDVLAVLTRHHLLAEVADQRGVFAVRFDAERATVGDVMLAFLNDGDAPENSGMRLDDTGLLGRPLDEHIRAMLPMRLADVATP